MTPRPSPFFIAKADRHLAAELFGADTPLFNVSDAQLAEANQKLVTNKSNSTAQAVPFGILDILIGDMGVFKEEALLQYTIETHLIPPIDLRLIELNDEITKTVAKSDCIASWSLPFDREDGLYSVATTHYLAEVVRQFWEERLGKGIIWYVTSLESLRDGFDRATFKKTAQPAVQPLDV